MQADLDGLCVSLPPDNVYVRVQLLHCRAAAIKETSPEFPPTFHSAIQVTIEEKGYSFVLYESYDHHCNAVVQEYFSSKDGHVRLLFHFGKRTLWRMFAPNATHPRGVCMSEPMAAEVPYEKISGTHVATTSSFVGARTETWTYRPRNSVNNNEVRYACNQRTVSSVCCTDLRLPCWSTFLLPTAHCCIEQSTC